jgi:hypothetical protein
VGSSSEEELIVLAQSPYLKKVIGPIDRSTLERVQAKVGVAVQFVAGGS